MRSTGDPVKDAERDLEWLREVRAVRSFARVDGGFRIVTMDYKPHDLDAAAVAAFCIGVLVGWRLPKADGVLG